MFESQEKYKPSPEEEFFNNHSADHVIQEKEYCFSDLGDKEKEIIKEFIFIKGKIVEYLDEYPEDYLEDVVDIVREFEMKIWDPYKTEEDRNGTFEHFFGNIITIFKSNLQILESIDDNDKKIAMKTIKSI